MSTSSKGRSTLLAVKLGLKLLIVNRRGNFVLSSSKEAWLIIIKGLQSSQMTKSSSLPPFPASFISFLKEANKKLGFLSKYLNPNLNRSRFKLITKNYEIHVLNFQIVTQPFGNFTAVRISIDFQVPNSLKHIIKFCFFI